MQRLTLILSTAALALWVGTLGGGVVGFNVGSKLTAEPQQTATQATYFLPLLLLVLWRDLKVSNGQDHSHGVKEQPEEQS